LSSKTFREALLQYSRYQLLLCDAIRLELREEGEYAYFTHSFVNPDYYYTPIVEAPMSGILTTLRENWDQEIIPIEVHFQHPTPDYFHKYKEVFCCPVLFNQTETALIFKKELLGTQSTIYNPYLQKVYTNHAEILLKQLKPNTIQDQVKAVIFKYLSQGIVDIEMVSTKLNMSRWTLGRKLKEEGTLSFRKIISAVISK
jgi:AraC-like DNA-binding protein